MTILALSILVYMLPAMGLLFVFIPGIFINGLALQVQQMINESPLVTVVMPVRNKAEYIKKAWVQCLTRITHQRMSK